jgi:pimeloyl-ACP methyl ester carboxylesterase
MEPGAFDLILLHGLGGTTHDWAGVRGRPSRRIYVPRVAFHGGWPGWSGPVDLTFGALADDVLAQLDAIRPDPSAPAAIGGISMGAAIALTIARRRPELVGALVLVAPSWLDEPFPPNLRRMVKLGRLIERHGLRAAWSAMALLAPVNRWTGSEQAVAAQHFMRHDASQVSRVLRQLPGQLPEITEPPPAVRARTAVLTWTADPIHPADVSHRLGARLGGVPVRVLPRPAARADETALLSELVEDVCTAPPAALQVAT